MSIGLKKTRIHNLKQGYFEQFHCYQMFWKKKQQKVKRKPNHYYQSYNPISKKSLI